MSEEQFSHARSECCKLKEQNLEIISQLSHFKSASAGQSMDLICELEMENKLICSRVPES